MLWYPGKAAFRVGYVASTRWNAVNIGDYSIAMGYDHLASADSSIAIGNHVVASGNASVALGNYVSTNSQNGAFVLGDNSTTVSMLSATDNSMRARFANGYRFYTSSDYTTNCLLAGGSNAWSTSSDVRLKENFLPADGEEFLERIEGFELGSWNYKKQDPKHYRHYGPMAQDFFTAFGADQFGIIGNDTTINQADFDGVNLIAIKALATRTAALKAENDALKSALADLLEKMNTQENALVQKLEKLEAMLNAAGITKE